MSSRPAPLVPPLGFVLLAFAPGGKLPHERERARREHGGSGSSRPRSSVNARSSSGTSVLCKPQRVAQHVAGLGRRRGARAAREVRDALLEEEAVQRRR